MTTTVTIPIELQLTLIAKAASQTPEPEPSIFSGLLAAADVEQAPETTLTPVCQVILPHKPGTHWPEQKGWYAGPIMSPEGNWWHLIVPDEHIHAFPDVEWSDSRTEIEGADSDYDGLANTRAMCDAGSELAKQIRALGDGVYLPARAEALLLWSTLSSVIGEGWVWTSTQCSAHDAWCQSFLDGYPDWGIKCSQCRAVPVRRLFL